MASKTGRPAMVEEFDEKLRIIVPDSQQVANTCAKVHNRLDHRHPEPLIDGASDSGYSSRTAATATSTQSGPSGGRSPPAPLTDLPKHRSADLNRKSSRRDRRDKDRAARPLEDIMQMGAYPGAAHPHVSRSPSKSYRRDSYRSPPEYFYEGGSQYHPSSTPVDNRSMDYHTPSMMRPPMPDYAPHHPPPPPVYPTEEYHSSRSARPGGYRPMYYQDPRPGPYALVPRGYTQQQFPYEQHQHQPPQHHGPPPSSVWQQGYSSSPYGGGGNGGGGGGGGGPSSYGQPDYFPPDVVYGGHRERSESRPPRDRGRRSSMYGPPPPPPMDPYDDYSPGPEFEDDYENFYAAPDPRELAREKHHAMKQMQIPDREESARRQMPPPSHPGSRQKAAPQIHQSRRPERRSQSVAPSRRHSKMEVHDLIDDFEDLDVEPRSHRRSRDVSTPDSRDSLRESRRYNGGSRSGGQVAVASSIRRRKHEDYYHDSQGSSLGDMENQAAEAEQYQEAISGRAQLPPSEETMMPKSRNGAGSDASSRKSGSNASATKTEKEKEKQAMTLSLNGMTLNFDNDGFQGKAISIRTGDRGSTQLNITDGSTPAPALPAPAPKRSSKSYVGGSSYSDNTGPSSRRRLEDIQRHREREDRRLEKSAHRTSRSGRSSYGGTRYH
ncbi:hypothetical protein N7528_004765 [Penicillium herquei]|nr:hypothetical protein N7528_004765 [Penicillium herquei]